MTVSIVSNQKSSPENNIERKYDSGVSRWEKYKKITLIAGAILTALAGYIALLIAFPPVMIPITLGVIFGGFLLGLACQPSRDSGTGYIQNDSMSESEFLENGYIRSTPGWSHNRE